VFRSQLESCARLTVIGYSFRDTHVNHQIRRWMNGDPNRVIQIVDPSPELRGPFGSLTQELSTLMRHSPDRVEVIKGTAGEVLGSPEWGDWLF